MTRESNQEIELNLPQLGKHVERATQIQGVLPSLFLSVVFKCVCVKKSKFM